MSDYGEPGPEVETTAGDGTDDEQAAQADQASGQEHHDAETDEDTASGGSPE